MAEGIEDLVDSQRRLQRDISHELRSPLARLNIALELARQRSGAESSTALDRIEREAERMNNMIGQLLSLNLLESGTRQIRKEEVNLTTLVKEIVADAVRLAIVTVRSSYGRSVQFMCMALESCFAGGLKT
jgi:two-component system sensor histidine kinase CpxA